MNHEEKHNERMKMMGRCREQILHHTTIRLHRTFDTDREAASHRQHNRSSHHLPVALISELQKRENEIHFVLGGVEKSSPANNSTLQPNACIHISIIVLI
jgi:hypothetical protein